MAYVKREPQRRTAPNHEELVKRLIKELSEEQTLSQAALDGDAPVIIEEKMRNSDRLQVYVKWSKWSGVQEDHRSAAILDAYERHFDKDYAARIVIALGLTPEEAEKLGIRE